MKRHGQHKIIVTDELRSYRAAKKAIENVDLRETGRWLNKTAENSYLQFRQIESADSTRQCNFTHGRNLSQTMPQLRSILIRNAISTHVSIST